MFEKLDFVPPSTGYDAEIIMIAEETDHRQSQFCTFTSGYWGLDSAKRSITVKDKEYPMPAGFKPFAGMKVLIRLLKPDGTIHIRTRSATIEVRPKQPTNFFIAAQTRQPRRRSASDGWGYTTRSFKCYLTHPGVVTDGALPQWLIDGTTKMRTFWNKMAYLNRQARRACSDAPVEDLIAFRDEFLFPAIDAFNHSVKPKQNITYPDDLKKESPELVPFFRFAKALDKRQAKGKPVPEGLADRIRLFGKSFKSDFGPFYEFERNASRLCREWADAFELKPYERTEIIKRFLARMKSRRDKNLPIDKGNPRIRYPETPGYTDWSISYPIGSGLGAERIFTPEGAGSIQFGPAVLPANSGHPNMVGRKKTKRWLRPVTIKVRSGGGAARSFTFAVLQDDEIPDGSYIKEWKLIHRDGQYRLSLVLEVKYPAPSTGNVFAGVDIGWRSIKRGIRIASYYNPVTGKDQEVILDLAGERACDWRVNRHTPGLVRMGETRWGRWERAKAAKNATRVTLPPEEQLTNDLKQLRVAITDGKIPLDAANERYMNYLEASRLFLFLDTFECRERLQQRRDAIKDVAKALLMRMPDMPEWLPRAGIKGIQRLRTENETEAVRILIDRWVAVDSLYGRNYKFISKKLAMRLKKTYELIAHDICRELVGQVDGIAFEENFLAKLATLKSPEDAEGIKRSTKYRFWAALSSLVDAIEKIAPKYGLRTKRVEAANTTSICYRCGAVNDVGISRIFVCAGCGSPTDQDYNAARNISRIASGATQPKPEPATVTA